MKSFKTFLKEGGGAVTGVGRINTKNVDATLNSIYKNVLPKIGLSKADTRVLGSTGKKGPDDSSGDIDMAVSIEKLMKSLNVHSADEIMQAIHKKLGGKYQTVILKGLGIVSLAFPIENTDGTQKNATVQLDLMLVDNLDFSNFAYWSPTYRESAYKGLHRNALLKAIAAFMDVKVTKKLLDKNGVEVDAEWDKNVYDFNRGFFRATKSNISTKTGKLIKNGKLINIRDVTKEPETIIKALLGPKAKVADANSFESIFKIITSSNFIHKKKKDEILKGAAHEIVTKGVTIPKEIQPWVK